MKMKSTKTYSWNAISLCILSILLLSSCYSPKAVMRIAPENEDVRWQYGQAFARQQANGLQVEGAYNGENKEYFFFDVEVTNLLEEEVLVDPTRFFLDVNGFKYRAVDPEAFLLGMDIDASKRKANAKNTAIIVGVLAVAATAAVIASAANDNNNSTPADNSSNFVQGLDNVALAADFISIFPSVVMDLSGNNNNGIQELPPANPDDRDFWTDFTLRKTTLRKNERVTGKVLFPKSDLTDQFKMVMPVGEETFRLNFRRMLYIPK